MASCSPKTSIEPVKLFCGVILSPTLSQDEAVAGLNGIFGVIDYISPLVDFCKYTEYYNPEMGDDLKRFFVSFEELAHRGLLPDMKLKSIQLEKKLSVDGKRRVNLDPGYMTLGQLFLASTKDNFFRIYLRDGIYAEVTLYYERGEFRSFPWTYRDYASEEYHAVFHRMRGLLKQKRGENG